MRNMLDTMRAGELAVLRQLVTMFAKLLQRSSMTKATEADVARSFGGCGKLGDTGKLFLASP